MEPVENHVLVELHVPDFERVKQYYGKLGFAVVRETKSDGKGEYLVLQMEGNFLCFWAGSESEYRQCGQAPSPAAIGCERLPHRRSIWLLHPNLLSVQCLK